MLCQHSVGKDGGRVYLAAALPNTETCGTKHQGNFVPLDPDFMYIVSQKTHKLHVFQEPKMPFRLLDLTYKATLMDMALPLEEWISMLVLITAIGSNDGKHITSKDVDSKRMSVAAPLKTLAHFKKRIQAEGNLTNKGH
jgi:hypothetical protein